MACFWVLSQLEPCSSALELKKASFYSPVLGRGNCARQDQETCGRQCPEVRLLVTPERGAAGAE